MYIGQLHSSWTMEETTETATTELESNSKEERQQSVPMDGPDLQLNQDISDATEKIIDNNGDDVDADEGAASDEGVQV